MQLTASGTVLPLGSSSAGSGRCAIDRSLGEHDARGTALKRGLWLIGAVLLAYGSALPGDFVWLDHIEVERAGYRVETSDDLSKLFRYSLDRYLIRDRVQPEDMSGGYFRPLYGLSISADWFLFGARPAFYHAENLLWHAALVLLLYGLGLRLFAALHRGRTIAFSAALLFAVHPLAIQSVSWISGRKDAMCGAFIAAAMLALLRAGEQPGAVRLALFGVLAGIATLAASLSKELGLLVPVLGCGLVWAWRPPSEAGQSFQRARAARALVALWLPALAVGIYRMAGIGIADLNASRPAEGLFANVATSATLLWRYVAAVLLPGRPRLSDAWPVAQAAGPGEIAAVVGMLVLAGLGIAAVLRRAPASPALVWLGVLAAPATGLVPLRHFHAERYLYPAYWGLIAALLIALLHHRLLDRCVPRLARRPDASTWGYAALAVVAIATASLTATSNLVWWSDETLFRDAIERDPHYVEGRLGLALYLSQQGEHAEAVAQSRRAIAEAEDESRTAFWAPFVAHLNLAGALDSLGRRGEAYAAYRDALRYRPDDPRVLCRAGRAALALSRPAPALDHLMRAQRVGTTDFECDLALALAHGELGDWDLALRELDVLSAARPRNLPAHRARIRALLELGHIEQAEASLEAVQGLVPERADLLALEAWLRFAKGERAAALEAWRRAHELDPRDALLWRVAARFAVDFPEPPRPLGPGPRAAGETQARDG